MGGSVFRRFLTVTLTATLCLDASWWGDSSKSADSPKEEAMALAKKARRAEKAGHSADAYLLYAEASALQRQNAKYRAKMALLQSPAAAEAQAPPAAALLQSPGPLLTSKEATEGPPDPGVAPDGEVFDSLSAREYADARQLRSPAELRAKLGTQDFNINGNARTLFDRVARSFGLAAIYDGEYPAAGKSIRFQVTEADYRTALHDLEAATGSFVVPLSPSLFMVSQDTPQKRNDLEQSVAISIPVPQVLTTQELTEVAQAVKQVTNVEKMGWDSTDGTIVLRDRASRVLPAQALLQQLFSLRPEVMIDIEFLEVADSDIANYGFNLTNSFQAIYLGRVLNNIVRFPAGVTSLYSFGGGETLIGLTVAQAQAMFNENTSSEKILLRTQLRASQGQAATFHSGEKYPVITAQYAGSVPAGQQGQVYAPPVSFTYEDLGFNLKVTPHIHGKGEATLTIDSSFEVLTGQSLNNLPIIGRRQLTSEVRLQDGEWAIVAGLINPSDSKSVNGFWGLANIPLLGHLFRQVSRTRTNENLLIAIRPRLLSLPPDQAQTPRLRVGTETRPFSPL
jgi:general secretion pathway protein D